MPEFLQRWEPPLLIALAAVAMIRTSWLQSPDVLVDYGQQPYVAWRLAEVAWQLYGLRRGLYFTEDPTDFATHILQLDLELELLSRIR